MPIRSIVAKARGQVPAVRRINDELGESHNTIIDALLELDKIDEEVSGRLTTIEESAGSQEIEPHALTHQFLDDGIDPVDITRLDGYPSTTNPDRNRMFLRADRSWQIPVGGGGGTDLVPHAATHEPGGTDEILAAAWVTESNLFQGDQTVDGDLFVTGTVSSLTQEQRDKINQLIGDPTGSRMLMSSSYVSGLSLRHDDIVNIGRIACGNYDTQTYQPLIIESLELRIKTGINPPPSDHVVIHPLGGISVGEGAEHSTDPGTGTVRARFFIGAYDAAQLTGTINDARLSPNVQMKPIQKSDLPASVAYDDENNVFTGANTFKQDIMIDGADPAIYFVETDQGVNQKNWEIIVNNQSMFFMALDDGWGNLGSPIPLTIYRDGTVDVGRNLNVAGTMVAANGLGLTPLNATQLTSGTVPDPRLSINVLKYTGGYPGSTSMFLRSDGVFAEPPGASGGGDVFGPASAVDNNVVLFAGTTGKLIKDSGILYSNILKHTGGYPGGTSVFLNGDGVFATIPTVPHHATHEPGGTDYLVNSVWLNVENHFTERQWMHCLNPQIIMEDTNAGVPNGARTWDIVNFNQALQFRALNDAATTVDSIPLLLARNGDMGVARDIVLDHNYSVIKLRHGGTAWGRVVSIWPGSGEIRLTQNLMFNGTSWNRDDTSLPGAFFEVQQGAFNFLTAAAGANPANVVLSATINTNGDFFCSRYLQVGGGTASFGAFRNGATPNPAVGVPIIEVTSATGSSFGGIRANNFIATGSSNYLSDLTCGHTNFTNGLYVSGTNSGGLGLTINTGGASITGQLVVNSINVNAGNIQVQGNFHNTAGYVYPGRYDSAGMYQGLWFLASHGSYGLWTNTGFYMEGPVYPSAVESRDYVRAGTSFFEYGRQTAIGVWTDFTPFFNVGGLNNNLQSSYMIVGKTLFVNFYWNVTTNAIADGIHVRLPAGITSRSYIGVPFNMDNGLGMAHSTPNGTELILHKDMVGTPWTAGAHWVTGLIPIPIN